MITFLDSKSFSPQEISTLQSCQQNHPKSRGHCVKPYQDYKTTTEHSSILSVTGQWVCRIWVGISIRYLGDNLLTQFPYLNKHLLLDSYQDCKTVPDLSAWAAAGCHYGCFWGFLSKKYLRQISNLDTKELEIKKEKKGLLCQF